MKIAALSLFFVCSIVAPLRAADNDAKANEIADAVFAASGGANWPKVKSIQFTFNVAQGDKILLAATHHWDVRAGTDTVNWGGKTVTVNVWNPRTDADAKAAYQRWVNDTYWLLSPLKLKDPGVGVIYQGLYHYSTNFPFLVQSETSAEKYQVLHVLFGRVGLTPMDEYKFLIDPTTHLVRHWVYIPSPEMQVSGTWDDYKEFGGLKLSVNRQFGDKHIWFSDVKVNTDGSRQ